jgi:hypothetical protein
MPHTEALAVDALTISWEKMYAYAYPPICLIPKILQYMRQFHCQIILIAPQWPRRIKGWPQRPNSVCTISLFKDHSVVRIFVLLNWSAKIFILLVCRSPTISDSLSHQISKFTKSVKSTKNLSSKSTCIQSDCLASINRSFQAKVFSKQARPLLSASWRKGTQRDYGSKFKK